MDILIGSLFCVGLCVSKFVFGWVHFLLVVGSGIEVLEKYQLVALLLVTLCLGEG